MAPQLFDISNEAKVLGNERMDGVMDGEKSPSSKVESLQRTVTNFHKKYGHHLRKMKPWRDFCRISAPRSRWEVKNRLETNLAEFQINYMIIFIVCMMLSIVICPWCLFVIFIITLVWTLFLRKSANREWEELTIAGIKLTRTQQSMALATITGAVLLGILGQVFFPTLICCAAFAAVHSIVHPVGQTGMNFEAIPQEEI